MNIVSKLAVVVCSTVALAACSDSNNNNRGDVPVIGISQIQVLHGSPDAPPVNVSINDASVLSGVDYKQGSGRLTRAEGTYNVSVDGILPGATANVINADVPIPGDSIVTIAAVNTAAAIQPIVISQPDTPVTAGNARLFVLHGAAAAPQVDVYVTTPGADLAASAPVGSFSFGETLGPAEVTAGGYQIRVTAAGDPATVVYDSGETTPVDLADGSDLVVTALPNTNGTATSSPITLVALTGSGSIEIADTNNPTGLRVGHLSPDTDPVDILVNGGEYLGSVPYAAVTDIASLPADTYEVTITGEDNPGAIAFGPANLDLAANTWYSVFAVDFNANLDVEILSEDDPRPVALYAKVRIYHASPTAQDVDIYVVAPGTDINTVDPTLSNIPFRANTGYLALAEGDYEVTVTPTGTKDAAIGPAPISIANGGVYTAIARDPIPGEAEFGLIVLEDVLVEND